MIRVMIADDHHLVRQGIRALLERRPEIVVVGEARNGEEVIKLVQDLQPDVLLLDINMPEVNGIEVTRQVREIGIKTQVLILTMYSDESLVRKAFRNGARGYLLKNSIDEDLIEAVHNVSQHLIYLSPDLQRIMDDDFAYMEEDPRDLSDRLTKREREVCQMIAQGFTNSGIAQKLGISVKTVEKHRANLMEKLKVQDMASLIREAIKHGLVILDA